MNEYRSTVAKEFRDSYRAYMAARFRESRDEHTERIAERIAKNGAIRTCLDTILPEKIAAAMGICVNGAGIVAASALAGELADHIPYISTSVPQVMKELTNSGYFFGNLDKLGAALGFFGAYFRGVR